MKFVRVVLIALGIYVLVGTGLAGALAWFQPDRGAHTIVLTTLDADGQAHDTKLRVRDVDGQLWLVSGQWFRGWFKRAVAHPEVSVSHDGVVTTYLALAVDSKERLDEVMREDRESAGAVAAVLARAMLLFAPAKLLRLDPILEPVPTEDEADPV